MRDHHPGQRDDCDLGGAAADVADGVASRFCDRKARTDGGRQRLIDEPGLARPRRDCRLCDGAPLDRGHAGRDADHDLGLEQALAALHLADEVVEHALRDHEVRDHTFPHRAHHLDRIRGSSDHLLRLTADAELRAAMGGAGRERATALYDEALVVERSLQLLGL